MPRRSPASHGTVALWLVVAMVLAALVATSLVAPEAPPHLQKISLISAGDGVEIATAPDAAPVALAWGKTVALSRTSPERAVCGPQQLMAADVVFDQPTTVMLEVESDDGSKLSSEGIKAPFWQVYEVRYPEGDRGREFAEFAEFDVAVFPAALAGSLSCSGARVHSSHPRDDGALILQHRVQLDEQAQKAILTFGPRSKQLDLLGTRPVWMTRDADSRWRVEPGNAGWCLRCREPGSRHWCQQETFDTPWVDEAWRLVVSVQVSTEFRVALHTLVSLEFCPERKQLVWHVGGELRDQVQDESPKLGGRSADDGATLRIVHRPADAAFLSSQPANSYSIQVSCARRQGRVRFAMVNANNVEYSAISLPESWLSRSRPRCGLWLLRGGLEVVQFETFSI